MTEQEARELPEQELLLQSIETAISLVADGHTAPALELLAALHYRIAQPVKVEAVEWHWPELIETETATAE